MFDLLTAELESLLSPPFGIDVLSDVKRLARRAHDEDPEAYAEVWIPRLARCPELFSRPESVRYVSHATRDRQLFPLMSFVLCPYSSDSCEIGESESLERFVGLDFSRLRLPTDALVTLLQRDDIDGVTRLVLSGSKIGVEGVEAIVGSPHLSNLVELDLTRCNLGAKGIRALTMATNLPSLVALSLRSNKVGNSVCGALAKSAFIGQLERLDLGHNTFKVAGLVKLLDGLERPILRELSLDRNTLAPESIDVILGCDALVRLERLTLAGVKEMTDEALLKFTRSGRLPLSARLHAILCDPHGERHRPRFRDSLVRELNEPTNSPGTFRVVFDQHHAGFSDDVVAGAVAVLVDAPAMKRVSALRLYGPMCGLAVIESLQVARHIDSLRELRVERARITAAHIDQLADAPGLQELEILWFKDCKLDDDAARALSRASMLEGVKHLDISQLGDTRSIADVQRLLANPGPDAITPEGLCELLCSERVDALEHLDPRGIAFSDDIMRALVKARHLGSLRVMDVDFFVECEDELTEAFMASPHLNALFKMRRIFKSFSDVALENLRESFREYVTGLAEVGDPIKIDMYRSVLDLDVLAIIAEHETPLDIRSLRFESVSPENAPLAAFLASPHAANLESIWFKPYASKHVGLDDETVVMLVNAPDLSSLTELVFTSCVISDQGAQLFQDWPALSRMESFEIGSDRLSPAGKRGLREAPGASAAVRKSWSLR